MKVVEITTPGGVRNTDEFTLSVAQSAVLDFHAPLLGHVHLVTSTLFDIGVYLIVVGLVLDVLRSLGAEIDRHQDADRQAERTEELV